MTSIIDAISTDLRSLFVEIIAKSDRRLLLELTTTDSPNKEQRTAVESILSLEFSRSLLADSEPTKRGVDVDKLIGEFLLRWPIEP